MQSITVASIQNALPNLLKHGYIQNELFKLALWIIRVYGSDEYRYDLRNEYAATKAKEIVASGILD